MHVALTQGKIPTPQHPEADAIVLHLLDFHNTVIVKPGRSVFASELALTVRVSTGRGDHAASAAAGASSPFPSSSSYFFLSGCMDAVVWVVNGTTVEIIDWKSFKKPPGWMKVAASTRDLKFRLDNKSTRQDSRAAQCVQVSVRDVFP